MRLKSYLETLQYSSFDSKAFDEARCRFDHLAKPLDGLGFFEDLICRLAGIRGELIPRIDKRILVIACADNGIVEECISQSSYDVTAKVASSMSGGISSACLMAESSGCDTLPVDVGIKDKEGLQISSSLSAGADGHYILLDRSIGYGTKNFMKEPAMSEDELTSCVKNGVLLTKGLKDMGYEIVCTGEMGIGNTTTSTALAASLLHLDPKEVTGPGAGLDAASLNRKSSVIENAIERYSLYDAPCEEVIRCVGGFDLAFLTGIFIGGAVYGIPVVIDGIISAAAALAAARLFPAARDFMLPSHAGSGILMKMMLDALELAPVISGDLKLGEGTGALMLLPLLDMTLKVYKDQTSFSGLDIPAYERYGDKDA